MEAICIVGRDGFTFNRTYNYEVGDLVFTFGKNKIGISFRMLNHDSINIHIDTVFTEERFNKYFMSLSKYRNLLIDNILKD